jgi:hypothetical protein
VTFYRPDKHPKSGFIGSWASHRDVAIDALQRGCARTLICEDDVLFTRRIRPATLRAVERALNALPPDWMIFFLGHWPLAAYFVRHNVLRTSSASMPTRQPPPPALAADHPWAARLELPIAAGRTRLREAAGTHALFMLAIQRVSLSDTDDPAIRRARERSGEHHSPVPRTASCCSKLMRRSRCSSPCSARFRGRAHHQPQCAGATRSAETPGRR